MRSLLATLPGLAACFGTGPEPSPPTDATILFAMDLPPVSDNCRTTRYIHQVAFAGDVGYAVTGTFLPPCQNGSTGNPSEVLPAAVFQFPAQGGAPDGMMVGVAGMHGDGAPRPRLTTIGTEVAWAFVPPQDPRVHVESRTSAVSALILPTNGATTPAGMVSDATTTYVATATNSIFNTDPNHPRFPCCSSSSDPGPPMQYGFVRFANGPSAAVSAMPVTPALRCEQTRTCLVANASALVFFERSQPPFAASIAMIGKAATMTEMVAQVPGPPTSLAADDARIAWSTSVDFSGFASSPNVDPPQACTINVSTVTAPHQTRLLVDTHEFSCMDVALDGNFVYFTIVTLATGAFDARVIGRGLGRVALDTLAVETLDLGITAPEAGPRQLFVDGDSIITVAPFVVARYRTDALAGREDFHL